MRIGFWHDTLRFPLGAGDGERHCQWLLDLTAPALDSLGHPVDRLTRSDPATASAIADVLDQLTDADPWPRSFSDPSLCAAIGRIGGAYDMVVGHEMTPNQIRSLSARGTPFLDISLDPIRFGRDLYLRMRTNNDRIRGLLEAEHVPAPGPVPAASADECGARGEPVVLFIGQTDIDACLISNCRLARVDLFLERIEHLLQGRRLALKPHPYGKAHADLRRLHEVFGDALIVSDNIYALLRTRWVDHVVTLSSSVADEAGLFGKSVTRLITPDRTRSAIGEGVVSADFRIPPSSLTGAFWHAIAPSERKRRPAAPDRVMPASLREHVGQAWGYDPAARLFDHRRARDQRFSFAAGGNADGFCTLGWSLPEARGRWTDGALATLLIEPEAAGLELVLDCNVFVPSRLKPLKLTIRQRPSDDVVGRHEFSMSQRKRLRIALPDAPGLVEIAFEFSGLSRPCDAGSCDDKRQLGLFVRSGRIVDRPKPWTVARGSLRVQTAVHAVTSVAMAMVGLF